MSGYPFHLVCGCIFVCLHVIQLLFIFFLQYVNKGSNLSIFAVFCLQHLWVRAQLCVTRLGVPSSSSPLEALKCSV